MTLRLRVKKPLFHDIRSSLSSIWRLFPSPSHSESYSPSLPPPMLVYPSFCEARGRNQATMRGGAVSQTKKPARGRAREREQERAAAGKRGARSSAMPVLAPRRLDRA
jgi:hypothetical protein